jgi:hypothetical protein
MNCMYTAKSDCNIMAYFNNLFPFFSSPLITSNLFSLPIFFCQFFTLIALGYVDLCSSLMLLRTANVVKEETD